MDATKLNDAGFRKALNELTPAIGPSAALSFALMGLPTAWAVQLHGTPTGRRLLSHDPSAMLGDGEVARVLGIGVNEFASMVGRNFPEPDRPAGGTEFRGGAYCPTFRAWSVGTVGVWLGAGCPGKNCLPNHYVAQRVGAAPTGA